jgi:hypothetical protein
MRRIMVLVPVIAVLVLGSAWILSTHPCVRPMRAFARGTTSVATSTASRLASHGARAVGRVAAAAVRTAEAQEVLEFRRVPPESVTSFERRRARRPVIPAEPAPPADPADPAVPEPAEPDAPPTPGDTEVVYSKSGNVMRIGSDVHVPRNQVISGDLLVVGGDITVDGRVEGDVVSMGGNVQLNSTARVDGDVAAIGGQLTEEPGSSIGGQRVTAGGRGIRGMRSRVRDEVEHGVTRATHVAASFVWLMIMLAVAWGFSTIAPGTTRAALETLQRRTALSIGVGALVWALIIPSIVALCLVVAILCITIIGIPLALAALLGYCLFLGLMFVWGYAVAAAGVGEWILSRRRAPAFAGGLASPSEPSLSRKAVIGVLAISGSGFFGQILQTLFFAPPLQGLGTFISVVSIVVGGLAATFGAGAWLRTELTTGTLARWWGGRKSAAAAPVSTAPTGTSPPPPSSPSPHPPPPPPAGPEPAGGAMPQTGAPPPV